MFVPRETSNRRLIICERIFSVYTAVGFGVLLLANEYGDGFREVFFEGALEISIQFLKKSLPPITSYFQGMIIVVTGKFEFLFVLSICPTFFVVLNKSYKFSP